MQERTDAKILMSDKANQYKKNQLCREAKIKTTGVAVRKSAAEVPEALHTRNYE